MYNSEDYLSYNDLNNVENKIEELTNYFNDNSIASIPTFSKKVWAINEFPYVQEISRIENGIDNIGKYFFKACDWIKTREWIPCTQSGCLSSFSYEDINRWLFNLNLIEEHKNDIINIWNGKSYIYWNENSNFEWE